MLKFFRILAMGFALVAFSITAHASHLLGVELTYKQLSGTQYRLSFRLYRDCLNGQPQAIAEDNPLYYSVFNGLGQLQFSDSISATSVQTLPPATSGNCVHNNFQSCFNTILFEKTVNLPQNSSGYYVTNGRCCLGYAATNVLAAGESGLLAAAFIPPGVGTNSAPAFNTLAQLNTCFNEHIHIDCSATDPDGDSLSYYFVPAKRPVLNGNDPKPIGVPPFAPDFIYPIPLTGRQPLPGIIHIDPFSGIISGICNTRGQYLISVACVEWRGGNILDTVTRTFVLAITDCQRDVAAVITRPAANILTDSVLISLCGGGRTIQFHNSSTGADHYRWTFGEPALGADTSFASEPQHTYADTGLYPITLIAYGANCNDTATGYVRISDDVVQADFDVAGRQCIYDTLLLTDRSSSTTSTIHQYVWQAEGKTFYGNPATYFFTTVGSHTFTHTAISDAGCINTITKTINLTQADIRTGDTAVLSGSAVNLTASGGVSYVWYSPGGSQVNYPIAYQYYPGANNTYAFYVIGTDAQGCRGVDTAHITFTEKGYVFVPSAFTPNGDSRNDVLRLQQSGYTFVEFRVYDRRSGQIFHSREQQAGWDGSYEGHTMATGVYMWMARLRDAAGKVQVFKGDVMLVR